MPLFRRLITSNRRMLREHLLRLSPHDRYLRFCGTLSDFAIAEYCEHLDWQRHLAIGCFVGDMLRAVVELHPQDGPFRRGELAISVEQGWQSQGVGTELMRRAVLIARNRGLHMLVVECLFDNAPMRHIAAKFTNQFGIQGMRAHAEISIPAPNYFPLWSEAASDCLELALLWRE